MKKQVKTPRLITVEILTLITVTLWIVFEVYRLVTLKGSPTVPEEILAPISSNLDLKALSKLDEKIFFEGNEL
ncbi:hypothetical protein A3D00_02050 [Candidatus Woesebacteria bacterium RIFCSPHIGHO2_02_FULL_38_9]|uniref:Uncharacterized protein n=1 Tax=Candidatus Woesebacteria bacterium RIFCSPHIGHO2_01_FULL_39_28 TaxID=1802496 RepID=A0A1F7YK04_9BACT|nr:MAG: hypothetical protein A2627_04550 [Candidatus Woesebacteria bacterium RIFCSPHIGHO2_01_FULL_39_28]OGM34144.1 MAG: hypothetical protein A3D00_02050 [Candidatus Woesebacteria bacterium RIFCSPHIGHO2_02_FULL_38_9]OGM57060.1 MAG: hypothetical protein A3A50_05355 [Candidatus Woesebacteria bacterium RIFCSPLOWO2_01_FULL_38_20]